MVIAPTVHLNGTSKASLLQDLRDAHGALQKAIDAMSDVTPHGRDYYVQPHNPIIQARKDHMARVAKLQEVLAELEELWQVVDEQGAQNTKG